MYILDDDTDKKLKSVTIILNKQEMLKILGFSKQLLKNPPLSDHYHISNEDYQKEITLCICDPDNINDFSPRIQQLIRDDE